MDGRTGEVSDVVVVVVKEELFLGLGERMGELEVIPIPAAGKGEDDESW